MNRIEFGYERTTCACEGCKKNCEFMPGFLIPADRERMIPPSQEPITWAEQNLLASPGALVSKDGLLFRIPTLVPAVKSDGSCIHLTSDSLCNIHGIAPFGCSHFDCGPERGHLSTYGLMAVHNAFRDQTSLYHKIWVHLFRSGHTQQKAEVLRKKMREAMELR
jgi:hypothetical protein